MQYHLFLHQELAMRHDLSYEGITLLTYYARGEWKKSTTKKKDGLEWVKVEYEFDAVEKLPILKLAKRSFDRHLSELCKKELIQKRIIGHRLYVYVPDAIKSEIKIASKAKGKMKEPQIAKVIEITDERFNTLIVLLKHLYEKTSMMDWKEYENALQECFESFDSFEQDVLTCYGGISKVMLDIGSDDFIPDLYTAWNEGVSYVR